MENINQQKREIETGLTSIGYDLIFNDEGEIIDSVPMQYKWLHITIGDISTPTYSWSSACYKCPVTPYEENE